jgi:hypothetical protein
VKLIPLSRGKFAIVDDEDYEFISQHKWHASTMGYAVRNAFKRLGERKMVYMHREIIKPPDGLYVDHINHDTLDYRKTNLRICTLSQNQHNRYVPRNNTSGYKGVRWNKGKWEARINKDGKTTNLGRFANIEDAANAYKKAEVELFGEFAIPVIE